MVIYRRSPKWQWTIYDYRYLQNSKTHGTLLIQIIRSIILGNNRIQGNILNSKYNVI
jgi:hypothetical protein